MLRRVLLLRGQLSAAGQVLRLLPRLRRGRRVSKGAARGGRQSLHTLSSFWLLLSLSCWAGIVHAAPARRQAQPPANLAGCAAPTPGIGGGVKQGSGGGAANGMDAGPTDRDIHSGMPGMEGMPSPGPVLGTAAESCIKSASGTGWEGGTATGGGPGCAAAPMVNPAACADTAGQPGREGKAGGCHIGSSAEYSAQGGTRACLRGL